MGVWERVEQAAGLEGRFSPRQGRDGSLAKARRSGDFRRTEGGGWRLRWLAVSLARDRWVWRLRGLAVTLARGGSGWRLR